MIPKQFKKHVWDLQEDLLKRAAPGHPKHPFIARVNFSEGDWGHYVAAVHDEKKPCIAFFQDTEILPGSHITGGCSEALIKALKFIEEARGGTIESNDPRLVKYLHKIPKPWAWGCHWEHEDHILVQDVEPRPCFYRVKEGWKIQWTSAAGSLSEVFSDNVYGNPKASRLIGLALYPEIIRGKLNLNRPLLKGHKKLTKQSKNNQSRRRRLSEWGTKRNPQIDKSGKLLGIIAYVGKQSDPQKIQKFFSATKGEYKGYTQEQLDEVAALWQEQTRKINPQLD